ncbi:MAG: DNA polymerase III subunit epsilon [Rhodospirillaceae bacterium]|nr:DNA polymerase III subunit epsilon [Rhodospirillaceae bacterium]
MREIVLDTETTGLDPLNGHRVIEIGCVELINHLPTGNTFQTYLDPERDVPDEAAAVSGLTTEFVKGKPLFADKVDAFLEFIGEAPIIAHNANFDMGFINAELVRHGREKLATDRAIDTVLLARRRFPGAPASLDALCRRFNIDLSARVKHGALLDAELLAKVYLELVGGREPGLLLAGANMAQVDVTARTERPLRAARPHEPSAEEREAHTAFVGRLKNAIWIRAVTAETVKT